MKDELLQQLEYDAWAMNRWFDALETLPFQDEARSILQHVNGSTASWLGITYGEEAIPAETGDVRLDHANLIAAWKDWFKNCDPTAYASAERDGRTYFFMVQDILRHVLNHATYHRGELRGLCRAAQFADFPETDFSRFLREKQ